MRKFLFSKVFFTALLVFTIATTGLGQWNPHAGVIPSFSWNASITATSGGNAAAAIDHDDQTSWQSAAPLPYGFISKPQQNIFLNKGSSGFCTSSGCNNFSNPTDGNLGTSAQITGSGSAWFEISITPSFVKSISLKCNASSNVSIYVFQSPTDSQLVATWVSADNYNWKRFNVTNEAIKIKLVSSASFQIFEIAALSAPLKESLTLDFGATKNISWIETRHWAGGKASATEILGSVNSTDWFHIADLDPAALLAVTKRLNTPASARYLKIEHTLVEADYAKVFIWEINVWDTYGPFGPMPIPTKSNSTVSEIIGVNGIWGWGYDMYSGSIGNGKGPKKFNTIATHARNFHDMKWDVTDPDNIPDYDSMAIKGTQALNWLNWDKEYQAWNNAGLKVQASVQFTNKSIPQANWNDPYNAGYNYAKAFAQHFGPTKGNGLVEIFEAGNEPWDYPASFYSQVLLGMVKGAKDGDPNLIVLPCALQSAFPYEETATGGNFIGTRLSEQAAQHIDGINVHHYSYLNNEQGKREGIYPEHIQSSARAIINDIRFRNANLPGKKIYVTEWGWDSDGAGEPCNHVECVSEKEQALYAIRGAMMFIRLGVDRLTWYFYANGGGGLYSRCGLLGSSATNFIEKKSFNAFQTLINKVGKKYFLDTYQENEQAWIYKFGDANGKPTHIIAWRPLDGDDTSTVTVNLNIGFYTDSVWQIDGLSPTGTLNQSIMTYDKPTKTMTLKLSAIPIIAKLRVDSLWGIPNDTTTTLVMNPENKRVLVAYYPNPSKKDFTVQYEVLQESLLELSVYNIQGELVARPIDNEWQTGKHELKFESGKISPGIYYCVFKATGRIQDDVFVSKEKIVFLK